MSSRFSCNLACRKCEGNIGDSLEQDEKQCDEVETVIEYTCQGDYKWRM